MLDLLFKSCTDKAISMSLKDYSCNLPIPKKNSCVHHAHSSVLCRLSQCYCYILLMVFIVASFNADSRLKVFITLQ